MATLRAYAMPKWGIEMTEGVVAEWMVAEGVPFKKGDLLALIETDKITNEIEAEAETLSVASVECFMRELKQWRLARQEGFPVAPAARRCGMLVGLAALPDLARLSALRRVPSSHALPMAALPSLFGSREHCGQKPRARERPRRRPLVLALFAGEG